MAQMIGEKLHFNAIPGLQGGQVRGGALATIASSGTESLRMASSAAAIESKRDRSQPTGMQAGLACAQAREADSRVRAIPITEAPLAAKAFIVSRPSPELHPVTMMCLPVRSMPANT